jgi:hypothetical protein
MGKKVACGLWLIKPDMARRVASAVGRMMIRLAVWVSEMTGYGPWQQTD